MASKDNAAAMGPGGPTADESGEDLVRRVVVERLRARENEIVDAVLAHVQAISDRGPEGFVHPAALRKAVSENLEVGLFHLQSGEGEERMVEVALRQARLGARNGVRSETVLRRYAAGERLLADFVIQESRDAPGEMLHRILSRQREQVDGVLRAVGTVLIHERTALENSPPARLEQQIVRLLAGDKGSDIGSIAYPFEGWHVGLIAVGADAEGLVRRLATSAGRRLLTVPRAEGVVWAWLGGRKKPSLSELEATVEERGGGASIGIGEPRRKLEGWRQTHREAVAAFEVMRRRPQPVTRAREILLLAAVLRDETLAGSLRATYIAPLEDCGSAAALQETLRAYLGSGGNAVTTAAALGVDRHTVQRRLRKVEEAIEVPLHDCHSELAVALELERLEEAKLER